MRLKKFSEKTAIVLGSVVLMLFVINTREFQLLMNKLYIGSNSVTARFIGYKLYWDQLINFDLKTILLGNAMSQQNLSIVAGYVVIPYYFGLIGYTLFIALIILMANKIGKSGMIMAFLVLLFLNIGSGEFGLGLSFILVSTYILSLQVPRIEKVDWKGQNNQ